jgi:hypothetical protein
MITDAVFSAAVGCQIKWVYNAAHRLTRPVERTAASVAWWRLVHHLAGELGLPLTDAERATDTLLSTGLSPGRIRLRSTKDESVAVVVDLPRFLDATALALAAAIYRTPIRRRGRPRRDRGVTAEGRLTAGELAAIANRRLLTPHQRLESPEMQSLVAALVALSRSGVPFVVIGPAAATIHGAPWPTTELDVVIDGSRRYGSALGECLAGLRAHPRSPEWREGFTVDGPLLRSVPVVALECGALALTIHTSLAALGDYASTVRHADIAAIDGRPINVLRLTSLGVVGPIQPLDGDADRELRWAKIRTFSEMVSEDSPPKS